MEMASNDNQSRCRPVRESLAKCAAWVLDMDRRLASPHLCAEKRTEIEKLKSDIISHHDALWRYHYDRETLAQRTQWKQQQIECIKSGLQQLIVSGTVPR